MQRRKKQAAEISQLYSKKIRCIKHMDQTDSGCRQSESKEDGDRGSIENGINSSEKQQMCIKPVPKSKAHDDCPANECSQNELWTKYDHMVPFYILYSLKTQTKIESRCPMKM